jgi:polysaccharide deacetylase family protein (PEP-CTERM system associated)
MVVNALSVDVEDWFQVGAFENTIAREDWDGLEHRVEANTDKVLALFDAGGVKATFFTLGWVAERYPALIRRIAEAGHEIASHGWDHARVFTLDAEQFRADLARAKAVLEDASGTPVTGYRAPSFSIDRRTPWAHEVLAEEGYSYSSSVAPIAHDHYGWLDAPRGPWKPIEGAELIELPITIAKVLGREVTAGGGFFRLLPGGVTDRAVRSANADARAAIFYFHPWEIDPGPAARERRTAQVAVTPLQRGWEQWQAKLDTLIAGHRWGRMVDAARGAMLRKEKAEA